MSDPTQPLDSTPARRATDLPPDAPWWAVYLSVKLSDAWKLASVWWPAACAAAAEVYAEDPQQIKEAAQALIPAAWWPHLSPLC